MELLPDSVWLRYGLAEGALVGGKYRLQGLLGEGGMGLVVSAHDELLDRVVAIKLLRRESASDPVMVERFLREARAAAQLKSEHVARVLDVGTIPKASGGLPFMVLEFLLGSDLADVLGAKGALAPAVACNYLVQACDAVAEAHALGIVHRDLKPENLYLTTSLGGADLVKVLDFGVSKVLGMESASLTTTGIAVGSPVYMAPEQLRGSRDVGPRADVWSLGVLLYELLTASVPFEAETLPDLCLKITQDAPVPIRERRPELPAALAAVVMRCLEKDPVKRYFDAAELADALAPFAHEVVRSAVSGPYPKVDPGAVTLAAEAIPLPRPAPRRRALTWLAVAGLAAVFTGAWLAHGSACATVVLAAVDSATAASALGQGPVPPGATGVALEPEATAAVTPPSKSPNPPVTPKSTSVITTTTPRFPVTTHATATAAPAARRTADDDIPAFR